jgi:uncharacterized protein with gpF-like domain
VLTKKQISLWYAEFTRFRIGRERAFYPRIYAALKQMIIDATNQSTVQQAITSIHLVGSDKLPKIIEDIYIDAGRVFGAKAYQQVMQQVRKVEAKRLLPIGYNEELVNEIINYFRLYLLTEAVLPITDTMKAWILKNLIEAQQTGMSIQDVADKMIEAKFPKNRAIVIARTETIKAANYGAIAGAKKTGYKTNKQWVAARDNRTRRLPRDGYSHLAMDGVNIPVDEAFKVPMKTGGYDDIQQPGAPDGDAGNVIQCRCTIGFVLQTDINGLPIKN